MFTVNPVLHCTIQVVVNDVIVNAMNVRCVFRKVKTAAYIILALLLLAVSLAIGLTVSRITSTPYTGISLTLTF